MDYNYKDIKEAYKKLGVDRGRIVLLKTDLRYLGSYGNTDQEGVLRDHFNVLSDLLDLSEGTLVVATGSLSLCNTDKPFDRDKTPSEYGVLTEYIRKREGSVRSFHPFMSYTAIGKHAQAICEDVSRHSFGPETPEARMIDLDTLCISVGLHPRSTCSTVHHIETIMGVPYRYTKEFLHPVVRNSSVHKELFYMSVWYKQCQIKRNQNKKILHNFCKLSNVIKKVELGRGNVYSYSIVDFYKSTTKLFKDDIYVYLDEIPESRPYVQ